MEIWKPVNGFEEFYEVSNYGRVRSKDRLKKVPFNRVGIQKGKLLKMSINSKGYLRVRLNLNANSKSYFVHRLVAQAFIDNPNNLPVINHKDFNPLNNNVENLEWTTLLGNMQYSAVRGRFKKTTQWREKAKKWLDEKMAKSVIGTNIKTGETIIFKALNDCKNMGFQPSCVSNCCNGKRMKHKGYIWRFYAV
jgi:hypothetical protein